MLLIFGEQNLIKYHEESTNVSKVSVSLIASSPVFLYLVFFQSGWVLKGLPFLFISISLGSLIGSSLLSTGTTFPFLRCSIGIGQEARSNHDGIIINAENGKENKFDHAIIATHPDEAIKTAKMFQANNNQKREEIREDG